MYDTAGNPIFSFSQVAALRIVFASLILLPFVFSAIKKIKQKKDLVFLFIVGGLGNFVPAFLFTFAETELSSGYAGMLNSFTPIFTVVLGIFFFNFKLTLRQVVGLIIGTLGMVALMLFGNDLKGGGSWWHILAILFATLLYGLSLNTIKHKLQHLKSFEITSLALFLVLIPAVVTTIFLDTKSVLIRHPQAWSALGYILVLGVVGTAFAVILYNRMITLKDAIFASSVTYFIPIVAVFIGFSNNETINSGQIGSMIVVLVGVFLVNWKGLTIKNQKNGLWK